MAPILKYLLAIWTSISTVSAGGGSGGGWPVGKPVHTTSGTVFGHAARVKSDVSEYLGIRFGQSTAGSNRFLPPKRYHGNEIINGSLFGPGCPADNSGLDALLPTNQTFPPSEDCLYLNIWTRPQNGARKKAVMVWIYGGGFAAGDTATALYNGQFLAANEDVVVASMNYRINIFGFPGAPFLPDQNLGLLDQRLAIEWLRDNVERFGGDPNRITLFGESAGGSSVDYYAYAWTQDPIVNGFIIQSGSAMMTGPYKPEPNDVRAWAWYQTTTALGCGGEDAGEATLACAQGKTQDEIQQAMPIRTGFSSLSGWFGPTYDNRTLFNDVYARAAAGKFIRRPLLAGSNMNESLIYVGIFPPEELPDVTILENGIRCGIAEASKARAENHVPVWRYLFAGNKPGSLVGAAHGQEMPLVFLDPVPNTIGEVFQNAWGAFARDPAKGLSRLGWPKYDPDGNTLVLLGWEGAVQPDFVQSDMFDETCPPSQIP